MTKTKTPVKAKAKAKPTVKKVAKVKVVKTLKPYQVEKELRKMYPAKSAGAIAREFGVSRGSVLHQLKKFGIKITTRTGPAHLRKDTDRSFHEKAFLEKNLKEGLSIYKISLICNTTHAQISHFVKKHDLMAMVEANRAKKAAAPKPVAKKKVAKKKATKTPAKKKGLKKVDEVIKKHKK